MLRKVLILVAATAAVVAPANAQLAREDSAAAVAALEAFYHALHHGDSARAVSMLGDDAVIVEGGAVETRTEYLGHHLGADMRASRDAAGERYVHRVTTSGDVAWVVSTTTRPAAGSGESAIPGSMLAELAVLRRTAAGWQIVAIHWSARRLRS